MSFSIFLSKKGNICVSFNYGYAFDMASATVFAETEWRF